MQSLAARASLTFKQSREITNGLHLLKVQPAAGESIEATLARLRADPAVESAEVDQRRFPHAVPNDPLFTGQWYEQATQPAGIDAVTAWDTTTGRSDVVIAELDTGVRYDHPDLLMASANGKLLPGYDFVSDPTIANDGDGRDADASDPGDWIIDGGRRNHHLLRLHGREQLVARNPGRRHSRRAFQQRHRHYGNHLAAEDSAGARARQVRRRRLGHSGCHALGRGPARERRAGQHSSGADHQHEPGRHGRLHGRRADGHQ